MAEREPPPHGRAWRLLIPPPLWGLLLIVLSLLIGVVVGAGVGGLWTRGGCNASSCSQVPFDWHAATTAGIGGAVEALAIGYLGIVGVRAFVRFVETDRPVEKERRSHPRFLLRRR
jgi:hypothetical protein